MTWLWAGLWHTVVSAAAMFWDVGWSLVLGLVVSGALQAFVSKERMREALGRDGPREVALATAYGAASSSCSYAAAALGKTLLAKGAGLVPALAFLFASTNLVVELGIVLAVLIGWQFAAAEWAGGVVLVAIMAVLVRLTYPRALVAQARAYAERASGGHAHGDNVVPGTLAEKLRDPRTPVVVAQNVAMDAAMLWQDVALGFVIAGALATFVPPAAWSAIFLHGAPPATRLVADAALGPLVAVLSFVCSIGNVPMAAVLWASGVDFGGVLAFLYADLLVLPLLDLYRRYYGLRMAAYVAGIFYATIVLAAIAVAALFGAAHLVPPQAARPPAAAFSLGATLWLNAVAALVALAVALLNRRHPMDHHRHREHHHREREGHAI